MIFSIRDKAQVFSPGLLGGINVPPRSTFALRINPETFFTPYELVKEHKPAF